MATNAIEAGSLSASNQSDSVHGVLCDIVLSGTWTGTVELQVMVKDASGVESWADTGDSWTANGAYVGDAATPRKWRIDFTRNSGTLVYELRASMGEGR